MKSALRKILDACAPFLDWALMPLIWGSCQFLKFVRFLGVQRLPQSLRVFRSTGVFPIRDQYYEPLFNPARLKRSLREDRDLPGIDWNVDEQLRLLNAFSFNDELLAIPTEKRSDLEYFYNNGLFLSGDSEYLYNVIRHFKPRRILEVGSGLSTLMVATAIRANRAEDSAYSCEHTCIEPYEAPWLEKTGAKIIRKLVEEMDKSTFRQLEKNDIFFIDSSHIIRPQGDVLFEFLEIVPSLNPGVLVHVHDIFSPRDYLDDWMIRSVCFWNEQYLLEAFLTNNREFKIIGALNFLRHRYPEQLCAKCPMLAKQLATREPGSFWIQKT